MVSTTEVKPMRQALDARKRLLSYKNTDENIHEVAEILEEINCGYSSKNRTS